MRIVYNNVLPLKGFKAMMLFGILFVRKGNRMRAHDINHERIHLHQQRELLFVLFMIWYVIEYATRLCVCELPLN